MKEKPKILVAPLDWGLGHITRCIPIVNELIKQGWEVWLAGNKRGLAIIRKEFPQLSTVYLEGYNVIYHPSKKGFTWKIIKQLPGILSSIKAENQWLKRILKEQQFDAVISDNRFGLYNSSVYSIFITHQLHIKSGLGKWVDSIIEKINYRYINKFKECWIPDFEGVMNMSGQLSHGGTVPENTQYTGILSRFKKIATYKKYDLLIILSGPEPGRSNWEKKILGELTVYGGRACLVRGLPESDEAVTDAVNTEIFNHLSSEELNLAIEQSEWVICRSGYTSVMDLVKLQHKAILVPTPGQPEQEYLGSYLHQKKLFYSVPENEFSVKQSIEKATDFPYQFSGIANDEMKYKQIIETLASRIFSE